MIFLKSKNNYKIFYHFLALLVIAIFIVASRDYASYTIPEERTILNYGKSYEKLLLKKYEPLSEITDSERKPTFSLEHVTNTIPNLPTYFILRALAVDPVYDFYGITSLRLWLFFCSVYIFYISFMSKSFALLLSVSLFSTQAIYSVYYLNAFVSQIVLLSATIYLLNKNNVRKSHYLLYFLLNFFCVGFWSNVPIALVTVFCLFLIFYYFSFFYPSNRNSLQFFLAITIIFNSIFLIYLLRILIQTPDLNLGGVWVGPNENLMRTSIGFGKWTSYTYACLPDPVACVPYEPMLKSQLNNLRSIIRYFIFITPFLYFIYVVTNKLRTENYSRLQTIHKGHLFLFLMYFLFLSFSIMGSSDFYWDLWRSFDPIKIFREPWAKFTPIFIILSFGLFGMTITKVLQSYPKVKIYSLIISSFLAIYLILPSTQNPSIHKSHPKIPIVDYKSLRQSIYTLNDSSSQVYCLTDLSERGDLLTFLKLNTLNTYIDNKVLNYSEICQGVKKIYFFNSYRFDKNVSKDRRIDSTLTKCIFSKNNFFFVLEDSCDLVQYSNNTYKIILE